MTPILSCSFCGRLNPSVDHEAPGSRWIRTDPDNWAKKFFVCSLECSEKFKAREKKVLGKQDWSDVEQDSLFKAGKA